MGLNLQLLQGLAIILGGSLVDPQVLVGIPQVEILLDTTTQVVVVKVGVVIATRNMLKDEVHPMDLVTCPVLVLEVELEVVVMVWELQVTHRMVHMLVVLVLVVAPM